MAINIKEILHPSDSDSIKFEKVNYNFDQILANGGGPQGIQGVKGEQGADGATGVKGQKGELGTTGPKGEPGTAITLWDSVAIGTATGPSPNDSIIIKPKSASVTKSPTIWLGDSDFEEGVGPGKTNGEARLTLETGTDPDEVGHFLKYYKNSDHVLNVNHRYDGSTTWFSTKPDLGSSLNSLGIEFISDKFKVVADSEVNITTTSSNITFASGGNIEITGSTGFVNIARPVLVTGYLNVTGTSHIKIPAGTTADRPTGIQGMIRYNQTLTSFEGYDGTIWKGLGGLIDADQDTYIVAEQNTDEDILRFNVGTVGIVGGGEVATMGEDLSDGTIVSTNAIQFKTDQFNQGDIVVDEDQGFLIKAKTVSLGADQAQPANSASAKEFRRLDDYFYQESVFCDSTAVEITNSQPFVQSTYGLPAQPVSYPYSSSGERFTFNPSPNPKVSYKLLWVHRQQTKTISSLGGISYNTHNIETNIALPLIEPTTKLSYVKTGHMVQCWGSISFYPVALDIDLITAGANINGEMHYNNTMSTVQTWDDAEFILEGRIAFYFAELATFPYTNASDDWIYFPIPQRLMTSELIDDYNNSAILEPFDFWGAIPPGANYFNIAKIHPSWGQDWWKTYREKGNPYSGSTTDNVGKMLIPYMTLRDLRANQNTFATAAAGGTTPQEAAVTTISFNFSIPTDVKSYDVIDTSKQNFLYAGDNATTPGNLYKEQTTIDNLPVLTGGGASSTPTGSAGA
jgi:hypothetical protein